MDRRTASGIYMSSLKSWCASRALIAVWNCKYIFLFFSDKCSLEKTDSKGVGKSSSFFTAGFPRKVSSFPSWNAMTTFERQISSVSNFVFVESTVFSWLCRSIHSDVSSHIIQWSTIRDCQIRAELQWAFSNYDNLTFFHAFFQFLCTLSFLSRISVQPHTLVLPSISILCPNKALPWLGDFPIFFNELYISYLSLDGTFLWMQKA